MQPLPSRVGMRQPGCYGDSPSPPEVGSGECDGTRLSVKAPQVDSAPPAQLDFPQECGDNTNTNITLKFPEATEVNKPPSN